MVNLNWCAIEPPTTSIWHSKSIRLWMNSKLVWNSKCLFDPLSLPTCLPPMSSFEFRHLQTRPKQLSAYRLVVPNMLQERMQSHGSMGCCGNLRVHPFELSLLFRIWKVTVLRCCAFSRLTFFLVNSLSTDFLLQFHSSPLHWRHMLTLVELPDSKAKQNSCSVLSRISPVPSSRKCGPGPQLPWISRCWCSQARGCSCDSWKFTKKAITRAWSGFDISPKQEATNFVFNKPSLWSLDSHYLTHSASM